jgi:predicted acetyltransferase/catechol 2,3-dioxygenase-like lactoylglutathione lyase family enzyme
MNPRPGDTPARAGALPMQLVTPAPQHLDGYIDALRRGWSADNLRAAAAQEELARIEQDAAAFLAQQTDREALGGPVTLPDGSVVARLPGLKRWLWDGEFCGSIGLRWQRGTTALPPHCLGHIGYAVVPWKQRRGYATQALAQMLPLARAEGLAFVEVTTDPDNTASQRVIESNGGVLVERFVKPAAFGGKPGLRFRIPLAGKTSSPEENAAMAVHIRDIDHVVLRVVDLDAMLRFYVDALGCSVERRQDSIGLVQLRAGRAMIDLVPVDGKLGRAGGAAPGREGRNVDHVCLRVEPFDAEAITRHLQAHGARPGPVEQRYGAEGEGPSIYLADPEGNTLELKGPPGA